MNYLKLSVNQTNMTQNTFGSSWHVWAWLGMSDHAQLKVSFFGDYIYIKSLKHRLITFKVLMVKESCNLIGQEHRPWSIT